MKNLNFQNNFNVWLVGSKINFNGRCVNAKLNIKKNLGLADNA